MHFLNAIASLVAMVLAFGSAIFFDFRYEWSVVLLGIFSGALYIVGGIARSDALAYIHSALYFPLYKVIGTTVVLIVGIFYFGDHLTWIQIVGLVLVLLVPILLIDKVETLRQKDLMRGIWLTVTSAILISISALGGKVVTTLGSSIYVFLIINYFVSAVGQSSVYVSKSRDTSLIRVQKKEIIIVAFLLGIFQYLGFMTLLVAYKTGEVSLVYAINSTYIVIPILLSIWFYREHWNIRKACAIGLSVVSVCCCDRRCPSMQLLC